MHFCMGLMAELCSSAASDSLFFFNFLLPSRCSTRPPGSITLVSFSDSLSAQPLEHRATGRTCPSRVVGQAEMAPIFFWNLFFYFQKLETVQKILRNIFPVIENYRYIYGLFYSAAYFWYFIQYFMHFFS
jgi:hypothetical protein